MIYIFQDKKKRLNHVYESENYKQLSFDDRKKLDVFLDKWNWGASLLSWIWGLAHHKTGYAILAFILSRLPSFVGIVSMIIVIIVFGLEGNRWAWESKQWNSIDELIALQRKWTKWGVGILIVIFLVVLLFY